MRARGGSKGEGEGRGRKWRARARGGGRREGEEGVGGKRGGGPMDLEGNGVVLHPLAAQEVVKAQAKEALGTPLSARGQR